MSQSKVSTDQAALIIVMGVSGCGKSTLGKALSEVILNAHFRDGDDLHPQSNIKKMSQGQALTDQDRHPWLSLIRSTAEHSVATGSSRVIVIACSALRTAYRDILRTSSAEQLGKPLISPPKGPRDHHPHPASQLMHHSFLHTMHDTESNEQTNGLKTFFIHLEGPREVLLQRISARKNHFMKETMLDSQLDTLERPDPSKEENVIIVDLIKPKSEQVEQAIQGLRRLGLDLKKL